MNGVVLSTENAILLEGIVVAQAETMRAGEPAGTVLAMTLEGRINKSGGERAEILYLFGTDGAAAIISELLALATRMGPEVFDQLAARIGRLEADDAFGS